MVRYQVLWLNKSMLIWAINKIIKDVRIVIKITIVPKFMEIMIMIKDGKLAIE